MEESSKEPTPISNKKQPTTADNDQRALFFHRKAVYGERGTEYKLVASTHLNSCCWVGTVTGGKEADGMPCFYTIEVFKDDPSMRGTIWREIRALSTIASKTADSKCENYLPFLKDQGKTIPGLKFALTTFTGMPLSDVLIRQKVPLQPSSAQRVTLCLTKALTYVHKADIIHGNISCFAVLTANGLSTDAGNIRLGCFYYSTVKSKMEKVSYPLNIYTARAIHDKQNATVTTDLENFIFLFYHLFVGLPWQNETDVKKIRKQKETFFGKLEDLSWEKMPDCLWQMAKKVKEGRTVDLGVLEEGLSAETDKKKILEWETTATMEEEVNKETNIVPGFFFPPKDDKKEQMERIEQLADAVGPDR